MIMSEYTLHLWSAPLCCFHGVELFERHHESLHSLVLEVVDVGQVRETPRLVTELPPWGVSHTLMEMPPWGVSNTLASPPESAELAMKKLLDSVVTKETGRCCGPFR